MPKRIYISCEFPERELAAVKSLCAFLQDARCTIQFAPSTESCGYRFIQSETDASRLVSYCVASGKGAATGKLGRC